MSAANTYCEPTVLWRLRSVKGELVEAWAVPTWRQCSLVVTMNGKPKSSRDLPSTALAVARAQELFARLKSRRGWRE